MNKKIINNKKGILNENKLSRFVSSLFKKEANLNAIWNNCLDGHFNCYGTSSVESLHLFQQSKTLLNKHNIMHCLIELRYKTLQRRISSLTRRFGYNMLAKQHSSTMSADSIRAGKTAYKKNITSLHFGQLCNKKNL